jgi:hypothetical protein
MQLDGEVVLAQALIRSGHPEAESRAGAGLERARALIEQTGARIYDPWIAATLAELADARGDRATHERHLREVERLFTQIGARGWAERAASELAALHA